MKQEKKNRLSRIREKKKAERLEKERIKDSQIIKNITPEQLKTFKEFDYNSITKDNISKTNLIKILQVFFNIIRNSSYLDEILKMTKQNISQTWFDQNIDKNFIQEVLDEELKKAQNSPLENVALKICYWGNRIAHRIETEATAGLKKHEANDIYTKYFLNPEYNYDITESNDPKTGNLLPSVQRKLEAILNSKDSILSNNKNIEQLHNIFLGLNLRNELWTLKMQMLKEIIRKVQNNKNSTIKITCLEEKEDVSIIGNSTLRLIIREKNGIAPIIMHCDRKKLEEFLLEYGLETIPYETSHDIIEFAQDGKIGIHFTLDEYGMEIFEYEAAENPSAEKLYNIMYRGKENER